MRTAAGYLLTWEHSLGGGRSPLTRSVGRPASAGGGEGTGQPRRRGVHVLTLLERLSKARGRQHRRLVFGVLTSGVGAVPLVGQA